MGYLRVDNNVLARTDLSLPEKLIFSFIKSYEEDNKQCVMSNFQFAASIGKTGLVVFCDMDGLKKINDTYGHEIGDKAIQAEAKALKASFRTSDVVGRLSGDEFAIVAIGQTMENFDSIYAKILHNCKVTSSEFFLPCEISVSVGAIAFGPDDKNLQILLSKADVEQYKEKRRKHAERNE